MRSSPIRRRLPQGSSVLLVPAAALAVHQLRYWLAYGSRAHAQLVAQGHSYLHSLVPWTLLALGIGATLFLRRVAGALGKGRTGELTLLWLLTAGGPLAIYTVQETLESFVCTGHPGGGAAVFGHGGLWSLPAAAVVAAIVVAVLRAGRIVLVAVARSRPPARRHRPLPLIVPAHSLPVLARRPVRAVAGRAPPRPLRVR